VKVANNGREAVETLSNGPQPPPFDLVLMDLQMPEMDGYQATAKLRADARFAKLPIIAMTAHATIEEKQRCLGAGMNDHISKPIDPGNLYETVGRFYKPELPGARTAMSARTPVAELVGTASQLSQDNLPCLPGLDVKDGLARVAGNRKLYLKLLRQFVEQQGPAVAQISDALARNDASTAERLAHTVKGVAGNLGARPLQQIAGKVEKAISAKTPYAELTALLKELDTLLKDFVGGLRTALPPVESVTPAPAAAVPLDPEQVKRVVQEMIGHLNSFDPAAGESLEVNREMFRALLAGEKFATFEQHINGFAFAEALALLDPIAKEKGFLPV
jgi:CheY-like chemotaxis protein/HPt (histidine-containing phosphotransfer) domain-containing protein